MAELSQHHGSQGVLHELDAPRVHALLRSRQAVLIDVREPGEIEAERIPGAASLPLDGSKRLIFQCGTP